MLGRESGRCEARFAVRSLLLSRTVAEVLRRKGALRELTDANITYPTDQSAFMIQ